MKTGVMKILPGVTICMILFTSDRSAIKPVIRCCLISERINAV